MKMRALAALLLLSLVVLPPARANRLTCKTCAVSVGGLLLCVPAGGASGFLYCTVYTCYYGGQYTECCELTAECYWT
jgi:hypothetical protein